MNDNEKTILSKSLNIDQNSSNQILGNHLLHANNFNTFNNNYKGSPIINKSPFGITFENENLMRQHEKRKYKEDLDYLMNLRRQMNEDEFERRYGEEFRRKVQLMNEKYNFNKFEQKTFMKGIKKDYESDMTHHIQEMRQNKRQELEMDKKYLDYLNHQNYLENQRKLEQKLKAKNETLTDLDHFYHKKQMEQQMKKADVMLSQKLIEEQNKRTLDREMEYRNKINSMNDKIYEHAQKFTDLVKVNNGPQLNELFNLRDDHQFNRKLAEMKEIERDKARKDPTKVQERLKELDREREINSKLKIEKQDHQKLYKDYLDFQYKVLNDKKQNWKSENSTEINQLMMPSYDYPNRPIPTAKKANDTIDWVKNNHMETLRKGKNYYLGDTKLKHNPITEPVEDAAYNKYLNKQKILYGINQNDLNVNNSNYNTNTLANAGNNILA